MADRCHLHRHPGSRHRWGDLSVSGSEATRACWPISCGRVGQVPGDGRPVGSVGRRCADRGTLFGSWPTTMPTSISAISTALASTLQDLRQVFDHMDTSLRSRVGIDHCPTRRTPRSDRWATGPRLDEGRRRVGLAAAARQAAEAVRQCRTAAGEDSPFDAMPDQLERSGFRATRRWRHRLAAGIDDRQGCLCGSGDYFENDLPPRCARAGRRRDATAM